MRLTWTQVAAMGVLLCGVIVAVVFQSPEAGLMVQVCQAILPSILGDGAERTR